MTSPELQEDIFEAAAAARAELVDAGISVPPFEEMAEKDLYTFIAGTIAALQAAAASQQEKPAEDLFTGHNPWPAPVEAGARHLFHAVRPDRWDDQDTGTRDVFCAATQYAIVKAMDRD